jgi:hypothetical protein
MKGLADIEKRVATIEKNRKQRGNHFRFEYTPQITATVQELTGNMPPEDGSIELHWPNAAPSDDATKLRWLSQYSAEKLNEFAETWEKSPYKRDKIALAELQRLQALGIPRRHADN